MKAVSEFDVKGAWAIRMDRHYTKQDTATETALNEMLDRDITVAENAHGMEFSKEYDHPVLLQRDELKKSAQLRAKVHTVWVESHGMK